MPIYENIEEKIFFLITMMAMQQFYAILCKYHRQTDGQTNTSKV